ncbi:MAG: phosphate ABC transporter substrate-binding protein [Thermoguttaceae bacterium]|jgi:phosphate transport system substrate-binding protein
MMKLRLVILLHAFIFLLIAGCGKSTSSRGEIRVEGSDTMVNVAQAWAENYNKLHPEISVQVLGGGSGVGIASLIDGNCDMADTSRKMKEDEIARAKANHGAAPIEHIVGYDALAIYVHKDNPLDTISLEELAEIYGDGGTTTNWSQLGVKIPSGADKITWVNRQNSSGTYVYFREAVLGDKRDYKMGSINQSGSKDVISLIAHTPGAIGYSGMGYATSEVKMLKVSCKKGEPGVPPTVENAQNNTYPITRPLQIYTIGEPKGAIKDYMDWIKSAEGQQVVLDKGYVPVFKHDK